MINYFRSVFFGIRVKNVSTRKKKRTRRILLNSILHFTNNLTDYDLFWLLYIDAYRSHVCPWSYTYCVNSCLFRIEKVFLD